MHVIETPRLTLTAAWPAIAEAEADGVPQWWQPLGFGAPQRWPPPLVTRQSQQWFAAAIAHDPSGRGWYLWYVAERAAETSGLRLIGAAGFRGRPSPQGSVEIGYTLLPAAQGRGLGTELVGALAGWAFETPAVMRLIAETYLEYAASVRVLQKNGFDALGRAGHTGALRFELRRGVFEQRRSGRTDQAGTATV